MHILGFLERLCMCLWGKMFFLVDPMSMFGFCSDFITENYTETHYTSDGIPVITKPDEMVGGCSVAL